MKIVVGETSERRKKSALWNYVGVAITRLQQQICAKRTLRKIKRKKIVTLSPSQYGIVFSYLFFDWVLLHIFLSTFAAAFIAQSREEKNRKEKGEKTTNDKSTEILTFSELKPTKTIVRVHNRIHLPLRLRTHLISQFKNVFFFC